MGHTKGDRIYRRRTSAINGKRVLQLRAQGKSWEEIANDFGFLNTKTVRWAANKEQTK